jgi:hypothetical protein
VTVIWCAEDADSGLRGYGADQVAAISCLTHTLRREGVPANPDNWRLMRGRYESAEGL